MALGLCFRLFGYWVSSFIILWKKNLFILFQISFELVNKIDIYWSQNANPISHLISNIQSIDSKNAQKSKWSYFMFMIHDILINVNAYFLSDAKFWNIFLSFWTVNECSSGLNDEWLRLPFNVVCISELNACLNEIAYNPISVSLYLIFPLFFIMNCRQIL